MAVASDFVWRGLEVSSVQPSPNANGKRRWGEDSQRMLELMLGQVQQVQPKRQILDLLGGGSSSSHSAELVELDIEGPLPSGWEKCLDLKTGTVFFVNRVAGTTTSCDPRKGSATDVNAPASPSVSQITCEELLPNDSCGAKKLERGPEESLGAMGIDLGLRLGASGVEKGSCSRLRACVSSPSPTSSPRSSTTVSFPDADEQANHGGEHSLRSHHDSKSKSQTGSSCAKMVTMGCSKCLMYVMLSRADPRCPKCGTPANLEVSRPQPKRVKLGTTAQCDYAWRPKLGMGL